ncbi:MAG: hypothetical protein V1681_09865 [Candidatus Neomarinimicrobiota bacterium]
MKNATFLLLILISLCVVQSCEDAVKPGIPVGGDFVYPLSIGNTWTYNLSVTYSDIHPDSIKWRLNNYSMGFQDVVTGDTTINSINVYEIREWGPDISDSYTYLGNDTSGMYEYAYRIYESSDLAKSNPQKQFRFRDIFFNDGIDFIRQLEKSVLNSSPMDDSLYVLDDPNLVYLYPMQVSRQWIYTYDPYRIKKVIIGKVTVETDAGRYDCFKVQREYTSSIGFNYTEYVGSVGLVKIVIEIENLAITTVENPDGIGRADLKYVVSLTDVNIQ